MCRCTSSTATASTSTSPASSFRDFLDGKLPELPGEKPRVTDWTDHLSTAFPEVRLKSFLEMRGADGGRWGRICALPALWVGLLYDDQALDAAWDLVKHWTIEQREQLRHQVPRQALDAVTPDGRAVRDFAGRVLDIAAAGLTRRARLNSAGDNEGGFLDPLREVVATGVTPADRLLAQISTASGRATCPTSTRNSASDGHASRQPPHPLSRDRALSRPGTSTSATATASIGSCAAIPTASRRCSCTAGPAAV